MHIPSADPFDVFYDQLETLKIKSRHSIKADIEENERPFKESVYRIS